MKLTHNIISNIAPRVSPFKLFDGGGMYLYVMPNGSKYWRFKYRYAGHEKVFSIGTYPEFSLKSARNALAEIRAQLSSGIDPNHHKKTLKQQNITKDVNTFKAVALEWYSKSPSKAILKRLEADIFPLVGCTPIDKITAVELLKALTIIEQRSICTAHRMLQVCSKVFRYAIVTGKAEVDITLSLKGALSREVKEHYSYLTEKELPQFLMELENYPYTQIKLALQLLILTFVRSSELREAKWEEISWDKSEWRIPAERMKMGIMHIVPLSIQAIKILRKLQLISGNREYIFPNDLESCIGKNTLLHALYTLGYKGKTTIHGFRATASTILNENGFLADVIERQLAHTEHNKVRASYNHAQHLPNRREMLQWWGDFIDQQSGNNILRMRSKYAIAKTLL